MPSGRDVRLDFSSRKIQLPKCRIGYTYADSALDRLLLEASAAKHRPSLIRTKRDRGFRAAFGADGAGFRTRPRGASGPLGLAFLAVLWVVDKLLCVEKPLFVCSKDEIFAANNTLQDPIGKLHLRLSDTGMTGSSARLRGSSKSRSPESLT